MQNSKCYGPSLIGVQLFNSDIELGGPQRRRIQSEGSKPVTDVEIGSMRWRRLRRTYWEAGHDLREVEQVSSARFAV